MNWILIRKIDKYTGRLMIRILVAKTALLKNRSNGPTAPESGSYSILFIKFWGIGNLLMLLPAARAARKRYPRARLRLLTLKSNYAAARASECFDSIVTIDTSSWIRFTVSLLRAISILKKARVDAAVDFEQFARISAVISLLIKAPVRIGFDTSGQDREKAFTHAVKYRNNMHTTRSFFSLLEVLNIAMPEKITGCGPKYDNNTASSVKNIIKNDNNKKVIIIHPGTSRNFSLRRWPVRKFTDLIDRLTANKNVKIFITGTDIDEDIPLSLFKNCRSETDINCLAGRLNIQEFTALIDNCDLVISCDTGTVHLASAQNKPVIGLYGPNTPLLYGPWSQKCSYIYKNLSCSPCISNYNEKIALCSNKNGPGYCMTSISVDEVFDECVKILGGL